jgi:hypothetical protein
VKATPKKVADALAAAEAQPDRVAMAHQHRAGRDQLQQAVRIVEQETHQQDRGHALARVEQEGGGGEFLVAGAQHVGGADIALSRCARRRPFRRRG